MCVSGVASDGNRTGSGAESGATEMMDGGTAGLAPPFGRTAHSYSIRSLAIDGAPPKNRNIAQIARSGWMHAIESTDLLGDIFHQSKAMTKPPCTEAPTDELPKSGEADNQSACHAQNSN